ncbi:hypothetical protein ACJX0J_018258, partial [Zea mays]
LFTGFFFCGSLNSDCLFRLVLNYTFIVHFYMDGYGILVQRIDDCNYTSAAWALPQTCLTIDLMTTLARARRSCKKIILGSSMRSGATATGCNKPRHAQDAQNGIFFGGQKYVSTNLALNIITFEKALNLRWVLLFTCGFNYCGLQWIRACALRRGVGWGGGGGEGTPRSREGRTVRTRQNIIEAI